MTFQVHLHKKIVATPLGDMLLAASNSGLAGAWFVHGQKHLPEEVLMKSWPIASKGDLAQAILDKASQQLVQYFSGQLKVFDVPLDLSSGTAFQQSVWREISKIAAGKTNTYGAICKAINKPDAARAVGAAVGKNPISIIIPCHRVVGSTGALTGYAGGLDRKVALLELEGISSSQQRIF
ncbi:MAG: methylated-DNA--[protein]-cysteine S-methyltransferase [Cytophagales bacterium]|nr:methylated-DNA--[protein]-cysteine S-methyltransferase [Cytophagales bacterium]